MSRRKSKWIKTVIQAGGAGSVGRVIPSNNVVGKGDWLRPSTMIKGFHGGSKVTTAISERKEELFRAWAKEIGKKV